jgi:tetratricopeptide (TPR) repeat protein
MESALANCEEKTQLLYLHGIGGIGKSSILDYWDTTIDRSIRLDCEQYTDFYDRLNIIAKEAVHFGVNLRRFDFIWHLRLRFIQGLEPAQETGRSWAFDVLNVIPFVGEMANIAVAIHSVGKKVKSKLKGKLNTVAKWLKDRLGDDYGQNVLEMMWKHPRDTEMLFLDALLEDLNERKKKEPLLFLMDHFENVDTEHERWKFKGKQVSERDLWCFFLSSIVCSVSALASRYPVTRMLISEISITEMELMELEKKYCIEIMNNRGIEDEETQNRVYNVTLGNPFVTHAVCDMLEFGDTSLTDIDGLQANTLDEVRLKTWRKLFSRVEDLLEPINRAGLVPSFNQSIVKSIFPSLTADQWDRMQRLSFVRKRTEDEYILHDLSKELVRVELGTRLEGLVKEVTQLLESASIEKSNPRLLGYAVSVLSITNPDSAYKKLLSHSLDFLWSLKVQEGNEFLHAIETQSEAGKGLILAAKSQLLILAGRSIDGEHIISEAVDIYKSLDVSILENRYYRAIVQQALGLIKHTVNKAEEAEAAYRNSVDLSWEIITNPTDIISDFEVKSVLANTLLFYGNFLQETDRMNEGKATLEEALDIFSEIEHLVSERDSTGYYRGVSRSLALLSHLSNWSGEYIKAEEYARKSLKHHVGPFNRIMGMIFLGRALSYQGRLIEAEQIGLQTLEISREVERNLPRVQFLPMVLAQLSMTQARLSKWKEAISSNEEQLRIMEKLFEESPDEDVYTSSFTFYRTGFFRMREGKYEEAESYLKRAIDGFKLMSDRASLESNRWYILSLCYYGVLLGLTNRASEAMEILNRALDLGQQYIRDRPESANFPYFQTKPMGQIGVIHLKLGEIEKAGDLLKQALDSCRENLKKDPGDPLDSPNTLAAILNNLGIYFILIDSPQEARKAFDEAYSIRTEIARRIPEFYMPGLIDLHNNLAVLHWRENDEEQAIKSIKQAIEIAEGISTKCPEVTLANIPRVLGNYIMLCGKESITGFPEELRISIPKDTPRELLWCIEEI